MIRIPGLGTFQVLVSSLEEACAALDGGAPIVQLRNKELSDRAFVDLATRLREATQRYRALFLVNDRLDCALVSEADGLHAGPTDLSLGQIRKVAPTLFVGISVDTAEEAKDAERGGANYVSAGPVYPTGSKSDAGPVLGLSGLEAIVRSVSLPVFAIGGITAGNVRQVLATGAYGVAVLSAISHSRNPRKATTEFAQALLA